MQLIFANKDIHEELISKTHKQLMHLSIKETTQSNRGTDLNGHFSKEDRGGQEAHEKMLSTCKY